jgi:hypothetical protein
MPSVSASGSCQKPFVPSKIRSNIIGPELFHKSRLHHPTRPKTKWKPGSIPGPSPPLKLVFRIGWETPGELIGEGARPVFDRPQATTATTWVECLRSK